MDDGYGMMVDGGAASSSSSAAAGAGAGAGSSSSSSAPGGAWFKGKRGEFELEVPFVEKYRPIHVGIDLASRLSSLFGLLHANTPTCQRDDGAIVI